jgi:hypothetical protein
MVTALGRECEASSKDLRQTKPPARVRSCCVSFWHRHHANRNGQARKPPGFHMRRSPSRIKRRISYAIVHHNKMVTVKKRMDQQKREMMRMGKRNKEKIAASRKEGREAAVPTKPSSLMERLKQLASSISHDDRPIKRA